MRSMDTFKMVGEFQEKIHTGNTITTYVFKGKSRVGVVVGVANTQEVELNKPYEVELELFGKLKRGKDGKQRHINCLEVVSLEEVKGA